MTQPAPDTVTQLTAHLFRENSGKMAAVLSRLFGLGQIDRVLDIVQDTFETALLKWRFSGIPDNPSAWLMQVAKNKALNSIKRDQKMQLLTPDVYADTFDSIFDQQFDNLLASEEIKDNQLRLLFACCHPELSTKNQIIITLYILCGFGVPEIANALLMNDEAVKKALNRSKMVLKTIGDIFDTRPIIQSGHSLQTVHLILYLIFNEGYKTTRSKGGINYDLCYEAIRLLKLLENHYNSETDALLALMFFNLSRFPARMDTQDEWLTLEEQDRSKWNAVFIEEGYYYLNKATRAETVSRFHIEAIITSLHCAATTFETTDWTTITSLYRQLELVEPDQPLVTLNRIIAQSYMQYSADCIGELEKIENHELLKNNFLLPAAKGDIYRRRGDFIRALSAYERALLLSASPADRAFLAKRIQQCSHFTN